MNTVKYTDLIFHIYNKIWNSDKELVEIMWYNVYFIIPCL
jgi:hypothetical protein